MSARHAFTLSLTLRSPFLFRSLTADSTGVDAAHLRDEHGCPVIPSDQVRGVVREALTDLADVGAIDRDLIVQLFGGLSTEVEAGEADVPNRGRLFFGDLTARTMRASEKAEEQPLPPAGTSDTTRVAIDDVTGTASRGSLQVIELVAPLGALVRFSGPLVALLPEHDAAEIKTRLAQALALISSIGAMKSAGFGEVAAVDIVGESRPRPLALPPASDIPLRGLYRVTFDRPILVNAEKLADNAVIGSTIVPGAVFKAALARRLELAGLRPDAGALGDGLAALSFSHAHLEGTSIPIPFSMVAADKDSLMFGDAGHLGQGLGPMIAGMPGIFQIDWKDRWHEEARVALGMPPDEFVPAMARTRTAIKNGVADDSKLFTTIARVARRSLTKKSDDRGAAFAWVLTIDATACRDKTMAVQFLAALTEGLDGIGKTDASATLVRIGDSPPPTPKNVVGQANRHIVVLASDALLVDPVAATAADGASWLVSPQEAYAAYWRDVLPGATLVNVFARERWAGAYLAFRRRLYGGASYHPFLVTTAGSTFVLDGAGPDRLHELCRAGLPLPRLSHAVALDWRTCPFVPENGYGRITADHCSDPYVIKYLEEVTSA